MACVVTDPIEFSPERNLPPAISSAPSALNPIERIVRLDLDENGADGGQLELTFQVVINDPNLQQSLEAKVFIDRDTRALNEYEIAPSGSLTRPFAFTVPAASLGPAGTCHKVELVVSAAFTFGTRRPVEDGDVGNAVWWIRSFDDVNPDVDLATCP